VADWQRRADENTLTRVGDRSDAMRATIGAASKFEHLSEFLEAGEISGNEFREQYKLIQAELRGAREVLEEQGGQDKDLDGWFDLYDQAEDESGRLNFDLLETLQIRYAGAHPGVQEKLLKAIGARDNATMREYRQAQQQAAEYYDMPLYAGLNTEESYRASRVLGAARDMVSFGQVGNVRHAIQILTEGDKALADLVHRANRARSNPERAAYRRTHPLLAKYYSDIFNPAA